MLKEMDGHERTNNDPRGAWLVSCMLLHLQNTVRWNEWGIIKPRAFVRLFPNYPCCRITSVTNSGGTLWFWSISACPSCWNLKERHYTLSWLSFASTPPFTRLIFSQTYSSLFISWSAITHNGIRWLRTLVSYISSKTAQAPPWSVLRTWPSLCQVYSSTYSHTDHKKTIYDIYSRR